MSESTAKVTKPLVSPYESAAEFFGVPKEGQTAIGLLTSPVRQFEAVSNLLKYKEGSDVLGSLTGSKFEKENLIQKSIKTAEKKINMDKKSIEEFSQAGDLLSSGTNLLNPAKAKTKAGQQELDRLLTIFEARQAEISARRARPGSSQTRLV